MLLCLFLTKYMPQPVNHPSLYIYVFLDKWLMQWSLKQKEEDLEQMEATIQSLIVKERASNDELQGVREELINVSISLCVNHIYCSGGYFWDLIQHLTEPAH